VKKLISHPVIIFIFKLIVSVSLILGLVFYIDFRSLLLSFEQANIPFLLLGFLLVGANTGIHFLRWKYVLRIVEPSISNADAFNSLLIGFAAGFFTPGQIGEIAGRIAAHPTLRKSHIVGITIIDKLYLLALTLITGVSSIVLFVYLFMDAYWHPAYGIMTIILIPLILFLFLYPEFSKAIFTVIPEKFRRNKLFPVIEIFETSFHNRHGRMLFLFSTLLYTVIFVQFYVFAKAFHSVDFFDSVICSSSVHFIKAVILPISIGDLGVRESASVFFFSKIGFPAAAAFNASICMFFANLVIPSVSGSLLVLKLKIKQ
jgi:uncharacterized membrane protein YbhN (UPF0104 family)